MLMSQREGKTNFANRFWGKFFFFDRTLAVPIFQTTSTIQNPKFGEFSESAFGGNVTPLEYDCTKDARNKKPIGSHDLVKAMRNVGICRLPIAQYRDSAVLSTTLFL